MYRHIAMYLCKHVGRWITTRIGKFYNERDHSTVSYAIRRIESRRMRDPALDALLCTLTEISKISFSQYFIAAYNAHCGPFTWTKGPEQLQRIIETSKEYQVAHAKKPRRRRTKRKKSDFMKN